MELGLSLFEPYLGLCCPEGGQFERNRILLFFPRRPSLPLTNPDLAFISARHTLNIDIAVGDPIPRTQHWPLIINVRPVVRPYETHNKPRFNYRKANWEDFTSDLEIAITSIPAVAEVYDKFQALIWKTVKRNIPRGHRKTYIPGLTEPAKDLYKEYIQAFNEDPFAEDTLQLGEDLLDSISSERKERWQEVIPNIDLTHSSKKAWTTIKRLNSEKGLQPRVAAITPNQVAHQLLLNGKPLNKEKGQQMRLKQDMSRAMQDCSENFELFTLEDLNTAIIHLKHGKASGKDGITAEMITHFGERAKAWLLSMLNNCVSSFKTPKIWGRARVVAFLKPGKHPTSPKSYRPISLLCIPYKLYERMILARIHGTVEENLTEDQPGFRPGRSCCSQIGITDFYMDFDFPKDRWLFCQNMQNANGILEEHQRRRRIRRVVSDHMNPFVAMEDPEFIARFCLRKDTMHDLIQEIQYELLVTQDRKDHR
ncbi:hypothetical protein Pcinc_010974 [Petrolisthes cinctipes]|uniref:Reverse transcriptase domain-containing protein n=1 Tax=Petrolisthes cinctipes TaxID=88211 RepID=A0AAE1G1S3_PETCI|nr:hypothetical protein Pcinc_010974 [Petrolisthes cinctipes]